MAAEDNIPNQAEWEATCEPAVPEVAIPIDRGDVSVELIELLFCSECHEPATHLVCLSLNECGMSVIVEPELCLACSNAFADRLRGSLPERAEGAE